MTKYFAVILLCACGPSAPSHPADTLNQACASDTDCKNGQFCYFGDLANPAHRCVLLSNADLLPAPDMSGASYGCSSLVDAAEKLSDTMYACRKGLNVGDYGDKFCNAAQGWHLCTKNDPNAINPSSGFFVSAVLGSELKPSPSAPDNTMIQGWTLAGATFTNSSRYVFGRSNVGFAKVYTAPAAYAGFTQLMNCLPPAGSGTTCQWVDGDDRDSSTIAGSWGVLCCQ